jgi:predicted RNase H-like nuclease (RuvC/YqgF family)
MNTLKKIALLFIIGGLVLGQDCIAQNNSKDSKKDDINKRDNQSETLLEDREKLDARFAEYRKQIDSDIDKNYKAIEKLKEKSLQLDKREKKAYDKSIDDLLSKNADLKAKANKYKRSSGENWDEFQKEFSEDLGKFGDALRDFAIKNNN